MCIPRENIYNEDNFIRWLLVVDKIFCVREINDLMLTNKTQQDIIIKQAFVTKINTGDFNTCIIFVLVYSKTGKKDDMNSLSKITSIKNACYIILLLLIIITSINQFFI